MASPNDAGRNGKDLRDELHRQLMALLAGGQAHVDFEKAIAGLPKEMRGARPDRVPYSAWQLLEHLRIAQRDILEFSTNREGRGYKELQWPEEYWPEKPAPETEETWAQSVTALRADREAFETLLQAEDADLATPFPWGDGQTLLREALLIADHMAYHLGEIVLLRRLLGVWGQDIRP